jgi:hypothetical protein
MVQFAGSMFFTILQDSQLGTHTFANTGADA